MTAVQVGKIAPNLDLRLWRPIIADPPVYSLRDLQTWVTITDVLDAHELLDLRQALVEKAEAK